MAVLDQERMSRIKQLLKWHPRGMTISAITRQLNMNRNLAAKYLDMLLISGQVEMQLIGAAKVFFLTKSVPVSAMLEFSSDIVIMIDQETKILFMNEQAHRIFGTSREESTGRRLEEVVGDVLPDLSPGKGTSEVQNAGMVLDLTTRIRGEVRHFRVKKLPTAFEDGTQGTTFIAEDITAQKNSHEKLAISEARYRGIVMSSGEAIIGTDPAGRIISWNPAAGRLYGYPEAEVSGQYLHILVHPAQQQEIGELFSGIREGDCIQRKDLQMVKKDGHLIMALMTICPILGEGGAVIGTSAIVRDITRETLEQQIRKREDQYRDQVKDLSIGIYRSTGDPHGRFVWGNTILLDILGYPSMTDLQNVRVVDLFPFPRARSELLEELHKSGFVKNRVLRLTKKDGCQITVSVTALAEFNAADELVFINGIVQEISE